MPIYQSQEFQKSDDYFGSALYPMFAEIAQNIQPLHRGPITLDSGKATRELIQALLQGGDLKQALNNCVEEIAAATGLAAGK